MIDQLTDRMLAAVAAQPAKARKSDGESAAAFDQLLQQKRQTSGDTAEPQDKAPAQEKDGAPKAEDVKGKVKAEEGEEIPDDAKAVLAAMMFQPQQELQPEGAVAADAVTGAVVETVAAETAEVPAQAAPEMPETAQVQAGAPQTAQSQGETVRLPQEQTADQAPETAEVLPQQARTRDAGQTHAEDVEVYSAPERTEDEGEQTVEAPLFQQQTAEDAVPVKVAEPVLNPERPLPIESAEAPQELAQVIVTGMENGSEVSVIRIEPEDLGPVQLTLTRDADGTLRMALEAASPKTTALLEKHASNVQEILAGDLRQEVRVEVKQNDRPDRQDWDGGQGQHQREQERQRQQKAEEQDGHDFLQRLRLGLIGPEDDEE